MPSEEELVLRYDGLARRASTLFQELDTSPDARNAFFDDPAGVAATRVLGVELAAAHSSRISNANRLLYALLNNDAFMEWSRRFQAEVQSELDAIVAAASSTGEAMKQVAEHFDRAELYRRVALAAVDFLDAEAIEAILPLAGELDRESVLALADLIHTQPEVMTEEEGNVLAIPVTAIAVVVLVIVVVIPGAKAELSPVGLSRSDLLRISTVLAEGLSARGRILRSDGE